MKRALPYPRVYHHFGINISRRGKKGEKKTRNSFNLLFLAPSVIVPLRSLYLDLPITLLRKYGFKRVGGTGRNLIKSMKNEGEGPRPTSFITAIYRCRDTPRSTKLSKLCREVNSPRGTRTLNRPGKETRANFLPRGPNNLCVYRPTPVELLLSLRFEATDIFDPFPLLGLFGIQQDLKSGSRR